MNRYVILDDSAIVTGSIETPGIISEANYVKFEDLSGPVEFHDAMGCKLVAGSLVPPEPEPEPSKEDLERQWRNNEIKIAGELTKEPNHPYLTEIEAYMQLLRDYPEQPDFPNGTRPSRPVTPSGSPIII